MKKFLVLFLFSTLFAIEVKEAVICKRISNRLPQEIDSVFVSGIGELICWCNLKIESPDTIYHEWIYKDSVMAKIKLPINFASENYRVWSKKRIFSLWIGEWKVRIKDKKDSLLKEINFKIVE
ncbi:MAG: DUF2914 domain-containing protein [candidate division WOR-3 bacterium]